MKTRFKRGLAWLLVLAVFLAAPGLTAAAQDAPVSDASVVQEEYAEDSSLPEPAGEDSSSAREVDEPKDTESPDDAAGVTDDVSDDAGEEVEPVPPVPQVDDTAAVQPPANEMADGETADESAASAEGAPEESPELAAEQDDEAALADLDALLTLAAQNGAAAAEQLNRYEDDEAYLAVLRELLCSYYGQAEASPELVPFLAVLDDRGDGMAADFAAAAQERATPWGELGYTPGAVLVKFRKGMGEAQAQAAAVQLEGSLENVLLETPVEHNLITRVEIPLWQTVSQAVALYESDPDVLYAEPDHVFELEGDAPEDLTGTELDAQWHHNKINTQAAWALLPDKGDGNHVVVAVIDTMPKTDHEDLTGLFLEDHVKSFKDGAVIETRSAPTSGSSYDHATAVAGVIAARAGNGAGGFGVAAGNADRLNNTVRLMALDVMNDDNEDAWEKFYAQVSSMTAAIGYAVDNGADVINMSVGFTGSLGYANDTEKKGKAFGEALDYAAENDVPVISSAGNETKDDASYTSGQFHYPSDHANAMGVISLKNVDYTDGSNPKASNSNYGWKKEISAPGVSIYTSTHNASGASTYANKSGTSFASPMVAGVAALVKYANPGLSAAQIIDILCASAQDVYTEGRDRQTGYGCVDAEAAVNLALATTSPNNLIAEAGANSVILHWESSPLAGSYEVYAKAPNGSFQLLETLPAETTSYIHSGLSLSGLYEHKVVPLWLRQYISSPGTDETRDAANRLTEVSSLDYLSNTVSLSLTCVATLGLNYSNEQLSVGETLSLAPVFSPQNATNRAVTWGSSSPDVATVNSDGLVAARKSGTTTITVTTIYGEKSATCAIEVIQLPESVELNRTEEELTTGETVQLVATVLPVDTSDPTVTWGSSNSSVASVDVTGLVTVHSPGTATITATSVVDEIFASYTVTAIRLSAGVELDQIEHELVTDETVQLRATVLPEDTSNPTVTWASNNPQIASVDQTGLVTARLPGTVTITAATVDTGVFATCTVKVIRLSTGLVLDRADEEIGVGKAIQLAATVLPVDTSDPTVTWTSSNPEIASVDQTGLVTTHLPGAATITATTADTGVFAACVVTVIRLSDGIHFSQNSIALYTGAISRLTVMVVPAEVSDQRVTWASDHPAVASVDQTGQVTAHLPGTATITATTVDTGISATCTITVTRLSTQVVLGQAAEKLEVGKTAQLAATVRPADTSNPAVTWASSNPTVASVDGAGLVTTHRAGTAVITVTTVDSGKTASHTLAVIHPVTNIKLGQPAVTLLKNKTFTVPVTVQTADGNAAPLNWTSGNEAVATVDDSGKIKAQKAGKTTITAAAENGESARIAVTVLDKKPAKNKVTKVSAKVPASITIGETKSITAQYSPAKAAEVKITYKTSNKRVLAVDKAGVLTAKKAGTATITVSAGGVSRKYTVTVKGPTASEIGFKKAQYTVRVGKTTTLKPTLTPSYADTTLKWKSSNKKVATVTAKGVVKGIKKGKATITVTTKNGKVKARCVVQVK